MPSIGRSRSSRGLKFAAPGRVDGEGTAREQVVKLTSQAGGGGGSRIRWQARLGQGRAGVLGIPLSSAHFEKATLCRPLLRTLVLSRLLSCLRAAGLGEMVEGRRRRRDGHRARAATTTAAAGS